MLANCYRRSLRLAKAAGLASIDFPAISIGVFGYPLEPPTEIVLTTVAGELPSSPGIRRVVFCCFGAAATAAYRKLFAALSA